MFFDYFYEHEAEQFAFYMIPKEIVEDKPFCELSDGSKLLYSIILDRVKLSRKNGWIDDKNRVYIIFTVEEVQNNMSAFIRKMAIDGYVVKLEIPELKEILSLLRYSSNNLNQLTKRVHETGRIYDADLEDIHRSQDRIWTAVKKVVATLAKL